MPPSEHANNSDLVSRIEVTDSSSLECYGASDEEMNIYINVSFWIEILIQPIIGCPGILANLFSLPILCSRRLKSIFNRLLACLALFDTLYIIFSLIETYRRHFQPHVLNTYIFCYFLYPFHNIILACTIFLTLALAVERFRAIRHPVEYHNWQAGHNPWVRVIRSYILPVTMLACLINLPKFFESTVEWMNRPGSNDTNHSAQENVNLIPQIVFTDLRFNDHYVFWYNNVMKILFTGIFPFLTLVILNVNIFQVIRRRRLITSRLQNSESATLKQEAAKQSYMLFAICGLFAACHALRLILAIHEFLVLEHYQKSLKTPGCFAVKFGTLLAGTASHLLLTLNSSINFAVYCLMSTDFRTMLLMKLRRFLRPVPASVTSGVVLDTIDPDSNMAMSTANHVKIPA